MTIPAIPANKDKPLRICHLADVHLGYRRYNKVSKSGLNQREVDVNLAFQEAISRIGQLKPDLTVIAGDLFHAVRPSNTVLTFAFRQLRRLVRESGSPVVLVAGNHESPKRADTGSLLKLFAEIEGVFVADAELQRFTFDQLGLSVTCLPHAGIRSEVLDALRADDRYKHNVLVVHAQVNENWVSDFGGVEIDLRNLKPHEWDYIALGHVHVHRSVAPHVAYPGAIEHTATNIWGEARELKGFLEVMLTTKKRIFHPLTSPREVIVLEPIDAREMDPTVVSSTIAERLAAIPGGVEGKIIRLELHNLRRDGYRYLDHQMLRHFRSEALNFTLDVRTEETKDVIRSFNPSQRTTLERELETYVRQTSMSDDDRPQVLKVLGKYLEQVESRYEVASA